MNWSKVKTILIFLFLVIDIFLAGFNVFRWRAEQKISRKAVSNVIKVLDNYGIKIEGGLISQEVPELGNLLVKNIVGDEASFLGRVLGKNYTKEESKFYSGEKSVVIAGNKFVLRDKIVVNSANEAEKWLFQNGIDVSKNVKAEYMGKYVFRTVHDGYEIFGSNITVSIDGEYTVAEGSVFQVVSEEGVDSGVRHITSVLPGLVRDGCRDCSVAEISIGYKCDPLLEDGFAEAIANPVYRIITTEGKEYYYDARL